MHVGNLNWAVQLGHLAVMLFLAWLCNLQFSASAARMRMGQCMLMASDQHGHDMSLASNQRPSAWSWYDPTSHRSHFLGDRQSIALPRGPVGCNPRVATFKKISYGRLDFAIHGVVDYDITTTMLAMTMLVHCWVVC